MAAGELVAPTVGLKPTAERSGKARPMENAQPSLLATAFTAYTRLNWSRLTLEPNFIANIGQHRPEWSHRSQRSQIRAKD